MLAMFGLAASPALGASTVVSGHVRGVPPASARVAIDLRAISTSDGAIVASTVPRHGGYSLTVPRGSYLLVLQVIDLRRGHRGAETASALVDATHARTLVALSIGRHSPHAHRAASPSTARTAAFVSGAIGIGSIPVSAPAGSGIGNRAEGGLTNGLLPQCERRKRKLLDSTRYTKESLEREQQLSDEGRTVVKTHYEGATPELNITGTVRVDASGKPVADLTVKNTKSGAVVDHVVTTGDPGEDISRFLEHIGAGVAARECEPPEPSAPTPSPGPAPSPPPGASPAPGLAPGHVRFAGSFAIKRSSEGSGSLEQSSWSIEGTYGGFGEQLATLDALEGGWDKEQGSECERSSRWGPDPSAGPVRWSLDASETYPEPGWRYRVTYPNDIPYLQTDTCGESHLSFSPYNLMAANVPVANPKHAEAEAELAPLEVPAGESRSEERHFSYAGAASSGGTVEEQMKLTLEANTATG
jgi:hypothetical protein